MRPQNASDSEPELGPVRLSIRLLGHAIPIAFFAVLEWGVKKLVEWTGQTHEWWARPVINYAAACFVISFFVLAGTELVTDCWGAITRTVRQIRRH
jgi:hypothetical protein